MDQTDTTPPISSWFTRSRWRALTAPGKATQALSPPARPPADDPLRRWRLAVAAGLPLEQPVTHAMTKVFGVATRLDTLAQSIEDGREPVDNAGLTTVLRDAQGQLNDALQACDQFNTLIGHFLHLMSTEPSRPVRCDLHELLSLALFGARALLPQSLTVFNRVPELPMVLGVRVELTQALIDSLVQIGRVIPPSGALTIDGLHSGGIVRLEFKAPEQHGIGRVGLALETAIDTLGRHRGTLDIVSRKGALKLRMCLPVAG